MKWFYLAAVVVVVSLALSPFYFLKAEDASDLVGKVVSYGTYGAKVRSLDPATCGDTTSASIQGSIYEGPYSYHYLKRPTASSDSNAAPLGWPDMIVPKLAASLPEISEDHLTYTIPLKKGVKYHRNECFGADADGTPRTRTVRADDFVLAFKRIADFHIRTSLSLAFIEDKIVGVKEYRNRTKGFAQGDFSRYDLPLSGVKAVDEHTLQITLKTPFPQLIYVLAINNYAPVPREVVDYHLATEPDGKGARRPIPLDQRAPEIYDRRAMVGTGPYYLAQRVRASKLVLKRNPDFRGEVYPTEGAPGDKEAGLLDAAGKPAPFVDVYYLTHVAEANPMWMLFIKKQSDSAGIPEEMYKDVIGPDKELVENWRKKGILLRKYRPPVVYWFAFNMKDKVLSASKSLRQALCLAYNVEQHIDVLYNGRGVRATTFVPSSFEGYAQAKGPYARLDPALAKKKVEQARIELVKAGVIAPGDPIPPITLDLGGREESDRKLGEFAIGQFAKIGITLKVELNDWPTLQEKVHNKLCQIYSMGWHADYPDPENFLQLYYTPNIKLGTNNTNYSNPEFDKLYKTATVMMPSPKRTALYVRMLKILNEDCPSLLLSEPISFVLRHSWVRPGKSHPFGYGYRRFSQIDAAARRRAGGR